MNREVVFEYLDNGERKSIHFVLDEISNSGFSFNPQIIKLMKDRECWFIEEKEAISVKRAV
ncbi:MAG: hypothetical protein KAT88_03805 [Spirochaetes bacterium]|nr:hypothetical protein [Spirochaetota bacterium]